MCHTHIHDLAIATFSTANVSASEKALSKELAGYYPRLRPFVEEAALQGMAMIAVALLEIKNGNSQQHNVLVKNRCYIIS